MTKADSQRLKRRIGRLFRGKYTASIAPATRIAAELHDLLLGLGVPKEDHLIVVLNRMPGHV